MWHENPRRVLGQIRRSKHEVVTEPTHLRFEIKVSIVYEGKKVFYQTAAAGSPSLGSKGSDLNDVIRKTKTNCLRFLLQKVERGEMPYAKVDTVQFSVSEIPKA